MRNTVVQRSSGRENRGTWLFYLIVTLIVLGGYVTTLNFGIPRGTTGTIALLTIVIIAYILLVWLSPLVVAHYKWLPIYFVILGVCALVTSLLTPRSWLAIMLYMGVVGLGSSLFWRNKKLVVSVSALGFVLSLFHLVYSWGWEAFWQNVLTFILVYAFVIIYVNLFIQQTHTLQRVQSLLGELEIAHQKLQDYADRVEALTISQERQRMAQELHDTLIQGLAGLILQLEAIDSHLEEEAQGKAQQTAQEAMRLARVTMVEARHAIQALRTAEGEQTNLLDALNQAIHTFTTFSGLTVTFTPEGDLPDLHPDVVQDIVRILQESLRNVKRHAQVQQVVVRCLVQDNVLHLSIQDNGVGFDTTEAVTVSNAFGIRGMEERAQRNGGSL
ncbi:sensor histidine kinase, partial [Candidatus Thorarchaeota archaeon]